MRRLWTYLQRYRRRYAVGGACLLATATLAMMVPYKGRLRGFDDAIGVRRRVVAQPADLLAGDRRGDAAVAATRTDA